MWSNAWRLTRFSLPAFFIVTLFNLIFGSLILLMFFNQGESNAIFQNLGLILLFILPVVTKIEHYTFRSYNQNFFQKEIFFFRTFPLTLKEILLARMMQSMMMGLLLGLIWFPSLLWLQHFLGLLEVTFNGSIIITTTLMLLGYSFFFMGLFLFIELIFKGSIYSWIINLLLVVLVVIFILLENWTVQSILTQTILLASKYGLFAGFGIFTIGGVSALIWLKGIHHIMNHHIINRTGERG
jgi:hypothetical protein